MQKNFPLLLQLDCLFPSINSDKYIGYNNSIHCSTFTWSKVFTNVIRRKMFNFYEWDNENFNNALKTWNNNSITNIIFTKKQAENSDSHKVDVKLELDENSSAFVLNDDLEEVENATASNLKLILGDIFYDNFFEEDTIQLMNCFTPLLNLLSRQKGLSIVPQPKIENGKGRPDYVLFDIQKFKQQHTDSKNRTESLQTTIKIIWEIKYPGKMHNLPKNCMDIVNLPSEQMQKPFNQILTYMLWTGSPIAILDSFRTKYFIIRFSEHDFALTNSISIGNNGISSFTQLMELYCFMFEIVKKLPQYKPKSIDDLIVFQNMQNVRNNEEDNNLNNNNGINIQNDYNNINLINQAEFSFEKEENEVCINNMEVRDITENIVEQTIQKISNSNDSQKILYSIDELRLIINKQKKYNESLLKKLKVNLINNKNIIENQIQQCKDDNKPIYDQASLYKKNQLLTEEIENLKINLENEKNNGKYKDELINKQKIKLEEQESTLNLLQINLINVINEIESLKIEEEAILIELNDDANNGNNIKCANYYKNNDNYECDIVLIDNKNTSINKKIIPNVNVIEDNDEIIKLTLKNIVRTIDALEFKETLQDGFSNQNVLDYAKYKIKDRPQANQLSILNEIMKSRYALRVFNIEEYNIKPLRTLKGPKNFAKIPNNIQTFIQDENDYVRKEWRLILFYTILYKLEQEIIINNIQEKLNEKNKQLAFEEMQKMIENIIKNANKKR